MARKQLHVALISCTPDPEKTIARAAKTCYSASTVDELSEKIDQADQTRFIQMLLRVGHLSTIEHVSFTFAVEGVSRALLAQMTRHRIASFSVQSQRYVSQVHEPGQVFDYILPPAIEALGPQAAAEFDQQMRTMQAWYNTWQERLSKDGGEKANEDARFVLPNAAETRFLVTMNARELMHFFALRCCGRAQWEIRELAWEMLRLVRETAPVLFARSGPPCLYGACPEGKKSCGRQQEMKERSEHLNDAV
jgi:thymidylate synthase (FAD)